MLKLWRAVRKRTVNYQITCVYGFYKNITKIFSFQPYKKWRFRFSKPWDFLYDTRSSKSACDFSASEREFQLLSIVNILSKYLYIAQKLKSLRNSKYCPAPWYYQLVAHWFYILRWKRKVRGILIYFFLIKSFWC